MALGKVDFAVYGECYSPSVTLGEPFAECFLSFAECFGHSANSRSPVVIHLLHLHAMFNVDMSLSSCIYSIQAFEYLLCIYITFLYGLSLSNMLVIFGIRLFLCVKVTNLP